jgi:hypothetical protein
LILNADLDQTDASKHIALLILQCAQGTVRPDGTGPSEKKSAYTGLPETHDLLHRILAPETGDRRLR